DRLQRCPPTAPRSRFLKAAPTWDTCYEFRLEKRTWRSARYACADKKGRLVTIREKRIQRFLVDTMYSLRFGPRKVWIGANDKRREMHWVWITGEKVSSGYSNWARGQPSCGFICVEDCAVMHWREAGGRWHDYHCSFLENHPYICEYDMIPEVKTTTQTTTTTTTTQTTTTTTTTTSTTPTTSTTTTTAASSTQSLAPMKALESEYLVHNRGELEQHDNTTVVLVPVQYSVGSNSARMDTVKEQTHSSSFGKEPIAFLIVGILMGLSVGACFFVFALLRRRRRHKHREEDPGVSYSNPYYGEVCAKVGEDEEDTSDGGSLLGLVDGEDREDEPGASGIKLEYPDGGKDLGVWKDGRIKEYTIEDVMLSAAEGAAGGVTGKQQGKHVKDLKIPPPPSPLHQRPKYVMNNYDSPPALALSKDPAKSELNKGKLAAATTASSKTARCHGKSTFLTPKSKSTKAQTGKVDLSVTHPSRSCATAQNDYGIDFEDENHYDEIGPQSLLHPPVPEPPSSRPPAQHPVASYDIPRSARKNQTKSHPRPQRGAGFSNGIQSPLPTTFGVSHSPTDAQPLCPGNDDSDRNSGSVYANYEEENMYESVENLRAAIEQQRQRSQTVGQLSANATDIASPSAGVGTEEEERYIPFPGGDTNLSD
ncbi:C-type lectin, partial [Plakobranchus ocellatus]